MQLYTGVYRDSGVAAYEAGTDFIRIQFVEGGTYRYTHRSAGRYHIDRMKSLAKRGKGLNSYINDHVRHRFESKEQD